MRNLHPPCSQAWSSASLAGRGAEDRVAAAELPDKRSYYGVFDGHGGSAVSQFLAQNLAQHLKVGMAHNTNTMQAIVNSFCACDQELLEKAEDIGNGCGATACVAIVDDSSVYVANCGDSRAVLARGGKAVCLSSDHRPATRADEKERILRHGGQILWNQGERVMGVLATTRAFGDYDLKQFGVSAVPEVTCTPRCTSDEFLILATDGVYNVLDNEEVVDIVRRMLSRGVERGASQAAAVRMAADALARFSKTRGSRDDISVIVVDLTCPPPQAAPPAPTAIMCSAPVQQHGEPAQQAAAWTGCAAGQPQTLGADAPYSTSTMGPAAVHAGVQSGAEQQRSHPHQDSSSTHGTRACSSYPGTGCGVSGSPVAASGAGLLAAGSRAAVCSPVPIPCGRQMAPRAMQRPASASYTGLTAQDGGHMSSLISYMNSQTHHAGSTRSLSQSSVSGERQLMEDDGARHGVGALVAASTSPEPMRVQQVP